VQRRGGSIVSRNGIAEPASHSAPFPAFAIALAVGLISDASATRPNMLMPVARFLVTNLKGRSRSVFVFYNDRGECENRIEEFKNGFAADRLSCHRFRANAFRYHLVNMFRLQLPSSMRSAQIETLFKIGARIRETARCIRIHLASGWPFQNLFQTVCNSS
jgi:Transposase DDE domain group 1